jgi:hypothetical protein
MKPLQALLALFAFAFLPLYAADLSDLTYTTTNGKVTITDCDEAATGELVIPDTIEGNPVTSIGRSAFRDGVPSVTAGRTAFRNCASLTSITIPDGVTSIGNFAFSNCTSLTSITIPDSVTSIGDYAFHGCTSLTSITIPDSVTSIGDYTFYECTNLTSITIPDSVTSIGYRAFHECTNLTSIIIPDSVTSIGDYAFIDCTSLTSFVFQGDAPTVGSEELPSRSPFTGVANGAVALVTTEALSSFGESGANWNGLTVDPILTWTTTNGEVTITDCNEAAAGKLTIPDTIDGNPVTSIESSAFYDCTSLTSITIPVNVTSIGQAAFASCRSLTSITIPDGVTSIRKNTFYNCTSLTSITIPDSVTSIGDYAFDGCSSLTSITIPDSVTSIGYRAFRNCTSLTSFVFQGDAPTVGSEAFTGVANGAVALVTTEALSSFGASGDDWNGLTIETILTWTTTGGEVTITDCNEAAAGKLTIPDTIDGNPVTSIESSAFYDCTSLTTIEVGAENVNYADVNGVLFNKEKTVLHTYPAGKTGASYVIANSVTTIGDSAFYGCNSLTSVTIGNGVTTIGDSAFYGCNSLTSVTIGNGVTTIGDSAFYDCNSLTSVTIGNGVTSIGERAFQNCTSLTNITIPDGVTTIASVAFIGCTSLTSITIPDSVTSIGNRAFYNCTSLRSITIPDSMTLIASGTFEKCTGLTSITIHDQVTSISYDAFADCTSLTSITIPNSVTSIGRYTFYRCTALTSITFQGAAPTVGSEAFTGMANGAVALVTIENQASFGDLGTDWNGLTVSMSVSDMITALNAQNAAVATARTAGQGDVTTAPASYGLVTQTSYNAVVVERDTRPTADQLAAVVAERDARPTADQLAAVEAERDARPTAEALVTVEAERDARPTQTAYDTAVAESRTAGQGDVTTTPASYSLVTQASYAAVEAERDARPTQAAYDVVVAERDAILSDIQLAYDEVTAAAGGAEADLVVEIVDPANAPLDTRNGGAVAQALEAFEVNTFASPANLDTEMALYDSAGTLIATNDDAPSAARPEGAGDLLSQLNFPDGLAGGVYYLAVGTYSSIFNSDFAVSSNGQGGEYTLTLPSGPFSGALEAAGIDWYRIEIGTNFAALQLQPLTELYRNLVEANASAISERDARPTQTAYDTAVAESRTAGRSDVTSTPASYNLTTTESYNAVVTQRDARPTAEQLAIVEAERDARFTEDQIRNMSVDHTVGLNEAGNMQVKIGFIQSADLNTYTPFTVSPDSLSVIDGKICMEFPPSDDENFFFRFRIE